MSSLDEVYTTRNFRTISRRVTIGGHQLPTVYGAHWHFSRGTVPTCSIQIPNPVPSYVAAWAGGKRPLVKVEAGYNGFYETVFSGRVESPSPTATGLTIECVGMSRNLEHVHQRQIEVEFVGFANELVELLLQAAGITTYTVALPTWELGIIAPQTLKFSTYGDAINLIAQVDGGQWFELPDGRVVVGVFDPIPSASPSRSYYAATPVGMTETGLPDDVRPRVITIDFKEHPELVKNRVVVEGSTIKTTVDDIENRELIRAEVENTSPWIAAPYPGHDDITIQNELIDDESKAVATAVRYFNMLNRLESVGAVQVPGDPLVRIGMTVFVDDPHYSGITGNWFVESYSGEMSAAGFVTNLDGLRGGPSAGVAPLIHPFACFSWFAQIRQMVPEGTGGIGADAERIFIEFDGSCSFDPDGSIVSWTWTDDRGNVGTGRKISFAYALSPTTVEVTLVVTDNDGFTDELVRTVNIDIGGAVVARVYGAIASEATATKDGGKTWQDQP